MPHSPLTELDDVLDSVNDLQSAIRVNLSDAAIHQRAHEQEQSKA
jgi:hypothetical protein